MSNTNSNIGLKVGLGILLALFLGTGFFASKLYSEKKETEATLVEEKKQVMNDLTVMAKQYDEAISDSEISNAKLVEARERIQGLMDSLKISQTSVNSLWRYKKKFLSLQEEMDVLLEENDRLKVENDLLATSLDSTQIQLAERSAFTDSLLVQNTELADVVRDASALQINGLKGFGVLERSNGKLIPMERARRSDKIRICYTVTRNTLADAGEKEFYVQVIDPNDNVMGANNQIEFVGENENTETGEAAQNKVLNYSLISRFNYEKRNLNVCEFISPSNKSFEKGRYVVNVFNEKELISSSEFTLK